LNRSTKPSKTVPLGGKYEKVIRNCDDDVDFQRRLRSDLQRAGYYAQSAGPAETAAAVTCDRARNKV